MLSTVRGLLPALLLIMSAVSIATPAQAADLGYDVKFEGADDAIVSDLQGASQLVALEDKAPASESALRRRADADLARLKQVLDSEGYYDASIVMAVEPANEPNRFTVTLTVEPGARYTLAAVDVVGPDGGAPPDIGTLEPRTLGLVPGDPANSAPIVAAEPKLVHAYAEHGRPFAKVTHREVVVDTATKTMHVTYTLDAGPPARFGPTTITGLATLDKTYVERRVKWRQGKPYEQSLVDDTKQTLVTSGLFGLVSVTTGDKPGADGLLPMTITLTERQLHTIGVGGAYDTSLGIEGNLSWEDRDLFGYAEDLTVTAKGGQSDSGITAKFTRPDAFVFGQDFVTTATFENELQDAFRALHQELQLGFQYHLTSTASAGYAFEAEHARVNEITDTRTYTMLGLPLFLREDQSDNLLNPTKGYRAGIELTPYAGLENAGSYVSLKLNGSIYRKLDDQGENIVAAQAVFGTNCCASLDAIPKDHRFFAGGGGTIRGYAYQKGGPLDIYFNPIGGRSLLVGSLEWRHKITDQIQLVPFVDAGSDYASILPDPAGKQFIGTGIGVRYFTAIGPVRFDVATPVDPHSKGDSPVQVYVSLGQAF